MPLTSVPPLPTARSDFESQLPPLPSGSSARRDFESQLASYRDLVTPTIQGAIPDREPKRHLYDLVSRHLEREGKGIRPALCLATCRAFGGDADHAVPSAAAIELL